MGRGKCTSSIHVHSSKICLPIEPEFTIIIMMNGTTLTLLLVWCCFQMVCTSGSKNDEPIPNTSYINETQQKLPAMQMVTASVDLSPSATESEAELAHLPQQNLKRTQKELGQQDDVEERDAIEQRQLEQLEEEHDDSDDYSTTFDGEGVLVVPAAESEPKQLATSDATEEPVPHLQAPVPHQKPRIDAEEVDEVTERIFDDLFEFVKDRKFSIRILRQRTHSFATWWTESGAFSVEKLEAAAREEALNVDSMSTECFDVCTCEYAYILCEFWIIRFALRLRLHELLCRSFYGIQIMTSRHCQTRRLLSDTYAAS